MRLVALIVLAASFTAPAQQLLSDEPAHLLALARSTAIRYGASLPSFICEESVQRTEIARQGNVTSDKLSIELTFDRAERYRLTAINGSRTEKTLDSIGGFISSGEFGTLMLRIFQQSSAADFEWKSWSTLRNHRTAVFTYHVPRSRSHYLVGYRTDYGRWMSGVAGYRGEVTLDAQVDPGRVLRLTAEAYDMPVNLHILRSTMAVDYDLVDISGREVSLPVRSETYFDREERHSYNLVRFINYRKFEAESTVAFGSSEPPLNRFAPSSPRAPLAALITIPDPPVLSLPPVQTGVPVEIGSFAPPPAPIIPKPPNDTPLPTFVRTPSSPSLPFRCSPRRNS